MKRLWVVVVIVSAMSATPMFAQSTADLEVRIQQIEKQLQEIDALKSKVADLEKQLAEAKKTSEAAAPTVTAAAKGSKIRIDGRAFVGSFKSDSEGPYNHWSTDISDAKLRLTASPWKRVTMVNRFSLTSARTDVDYLYLDYSGIPNGSSVIRLGQRKIDFGQETWGDNPIENMLISGSVSRVSGYATGVAVNGKLSNDPEAPVYEIGFVDGARGQMTRLSNGLQTNLKIGAPFAGNLFASASYFRTGTLNGSDRSGLSIAEINDAPAGATEWNRNLWELDVRYNYGPTGIRSLIPTAKLPPYMLGATYGSFSDSATGAADRDGTYWFTEGLVRLTDRLYSAARYSVVDLDDGVLAGLARSPAPVNSYRRTSLGLGYSLSDLTHLKMEYSINHTGGGASEPDLNQWGLGVATKF